MIKTVTVDGQKYQMDGSGVISKVNDSGTTTQVKNAALRRRIFVMMQRSGKMVKPKKPKAKRKAPDRSADTVSRQQSQFAKRGSIDPKKPKTALEVNVILGGGMKKDTKKTSASPTSKPKNVPKRKATASPTSKPKNIPDRKGSNIKLSSGKTVKQRLAEIDAENRKIAQKKIMAEIKKVTDESLKKKRIAKFLADAEAKAKKEKKRKK